MSDTKQTDNQSLNNDDDEDFVLFLNQRLKREMPKEWKLFNDNKAQMFLDIEKMCQEHVS